MKKLTDKEIDSIFKAAAEEFQPPFDKTSWEAMATRLDQPPTRKPWGKWILYSISIVAIFSSGIWIGFEIDKDYKDGLVMSKTLNQNADDFSNYGQNSKSQNKIDESRGIEKSSVVAFENRNESYTQEIHTHKSGIVSNKINLDDSNSFINSELTDSANNQLYLLVEEKHESMNIAEGELKNELVFEESDSISTVQEIGNIHMPDSAKTESRENVVRRRKPIYIRALVSPDISSLEFAKTDLVGTNYSILLEYPLSQHISISSGAIISRKVYSSPEEIVYGQYKANAVDGTCKVFDLPINANISIANRNKLSVYGSLGLSSYFMLSEDYTFYVNTNSGVRQFDWSFKKENIDWFSVFNLSLGAQYRVGNKTHIQAEPFLKTPIEGIGEWDLNLSSWGIFIGIKYRITN